MSLRKVTLSWEAFLACTAHALSTEQQEIMGVLIGSWNDGPQHTEAFVRHVMMMTRTDRRKDRVEVGYTQLAEATELASQLTAETGVTMNVIGWYHSHPHITVLPSHVDIGTQSQYQFLDPGFVGLIFAVFQNDQSNRVGRIEVMAFQSVPAGQQEQEDIHIISGEDDDEGLMADIARNQAQAAAAAASSSSGPSSGGCVRKEIPLEIVSGGGGGGGGGGVNLSLSEALARLVGLQETLMEEERTCYHKAAASTRRRQQQEGRGAGSSSRSGHVHACFDGAVYSKALCCLAEESALPLITACEAVLEGVKRRKRRLQRLNERLEEELASAGGGGGDVQSILKRVEEEEEEAKATAGCSDRVARLLLGEVKARSQGGEL